MSNLDYRIEPSLDNYDSSITLDIVEQNDNQYATAVLDGDVKSIESLHHYTKRIFDLLFSLTIVLFFSWLYLILAGLIRLESKGNVIFKQKRTGKNNQDFWCYKFRTMVINTDSHHRQASKGDVRITKIGRFLRRSSMDELPQFLNVILGNMSVVGPRPHMIKHTEEYQNIIEGYMKRHDMLPGITGWAQIKGFRGETTASESMQKRVDHDIWYIKNWSVLLDVKIVLLTVLHIFNGHENAY
ncbi:exopolysaccharide biosynthesis polyprenyl glycosylphosphotransferase [Pedobacter mucosus]|uniref:exopolysaccharide biosynthesis polyprenyl glycosylphosphotransferase n=1 Tax=Pedobacter mucosus TaxID=2895286 RepID=UPI001EE3C5B5|nr:exopolysaccharide biosynthesis polyprenyl glycosylphosphotransferase [Pedobacter mucosus]UKT62229.1 exopolysaccharide biosynthesis polyprenyl glycosylphosphotransferase [Pedobacter mucosus]